VPFEFIKEVEVKTGGYEAEYGGATGGVLSVITKSGGNDFEGDLFGYWSDDSLQSEVPPTAAFGQDLGFTEYDFGAAVGGKFIEDKLWYFVAVNPSREEVKYTTRTGIENDEVEESLFYAGKLTWQVHPSHQLVASLFGDPTDTTDDLSRGAAGVVGHDLEFGADNFGLSYNGTLSSTLFAELSDGRSDQTNRQTPFDPDVPFYQVRSPETVFFALEQNCPGDNSQIEALDDGGRFATTVFNQGCRGGTFHQETGDSSRDDVRGALTWFGATGGIDHEVKLGATLRAVEYEDHGHYPGPSPAPFLDSTGAVVDANGLAGAWIRLFDGFVSIIEYDQNSAGETDEQAIFVQDRLRLGDYFSLNLGVRADSFNSTGDLSGQVAGRELDFDFGDMVAPRVGFTWDVAKNGRSKLYGHFGRFYESVPLDINARAFGNEQFNFFYFYYPDGGSLPTAANPGTHFYTYRLGGGTLVDPDLEPMYTEELLAGFEYEILPNVAVGIKYTDRSIEDVVEDISVTGGTTYFITNPGGVLTIDPVTGDPALVDTDGDGFVDSPGEVFFPEAQRDYESLEVTLNKRCSNNWQMFASYVNSENVGNYGGLFRQDNGQLDPNITSLFDLPDLLDGAYGPLPNDREHQFKVYGSYLWPMRLVTGFYAQFLSGTPITQFGAHHLYGRTERFVTPRGSYGTMPDIWNIDLHFEYPISFRGGAELKLIADLFNVTDQQEPTVIDQEWTLAHIRNSPAPGVIDPVQLNCGGPGTGPGTACENGNSLFGEPTQYQQPRTLRLGVKLSF